MCSEQKKIHFNSQISTKPIKRPQDQASTDYTGSNSNRGRSTYTSGPQSCMSMTGQRITVQSLAGPQSESMKCTLYHQT